MYCEHAEENGDFLIVLQLRLVYSTSISRLGMGLNLFSSSLWHFVLLIKTFHLI